MTSKQNGIANQQLIMALTELPGIGKEKAKELINAGVKKISDLKKSEYSRLLSKETIAYINYPIDDAIPWEFADKFIKKLNGVIPSGDVIGVGSYRRKLDYMNDLDILTIIELNKVIAGITKIANIKQEILSGDARISIIIEFSGKIFRADIFKTTKKELSFALFHWTGNKIFNIRTRAHAKRMGYKLNQHGLFDRKTGKSVLNAKKELDIFKFLNITFKHPYERNE